MACACKFFSSSFKLESRPLVFCIFPLISSKMGLETSASRGFPIFTILPNTARSLRSSFLCNAQDMPWLCISARTRLKPDFSFIFFNALAARCLQVIEFLFLGIRGIAGLETYPLDRALGAQTCQFLALNECFLNKCCVSLLRSVSYVQFLC